MDLTLLARAALPALQALPPCPGGPAPDLAELNALCGGYTVPQALALLRDGLLAAALPLPPAPVREPDPAVPLATLQYLAAQRRVRLPGACHCFTL